MSILVVDDDDDVREVLAETLEHFGYPVLQAASGEEALPILAASHNICLMITDIRMPGMSGLELAEQVRRAYAQVKIIVTSGYFHPQQVHDRFLRKPFQMKDLASAVKAELG